MTKLQKRLISLSLDMKDRSWCSCSVCKQIVKRAGFGSSENVCWKSYSCKEIAENSCKNWPKRMIKPENGDSCIRISCFLCEIMLNTSQQPDRRWALRATRPKGHPRAWLLPVHHPKCPPLAFGDTQFWWLVHSLKAKLHRVAKKKKRDYISNLSSPKTCFPLGLFASCP